MGETAPGHAEILRIVAPNPGAMTLEGTNTYLYGSDPCAVIDPGPDDDGHREAILGAAAARGGIGALVLTHDHGDHSEGAQPLASAAGNAPIIRPLADVPEVRGRIAAPNSGTSAPTAAGTSAPTAAGALALTALATPGHAEDHVVLLTEDGVCFSGDLVLGEGSTFVPPDGGSLAAYMDSLRLLRAEEVDLICPGHGPWITDPAAKLNEYIEHREMRERRLIEAIEGGEHSKAALLAEAWSDVPAELRPAAAMVMDAHLAKLETEGRLRNLELLD
jgi:glyoxylase-like metal-dependent hydrolase (beta-lactamase superfamily II)